jgi:hypothetical protein
VLQYDAFNPSGLGRARRKTALTSRAFSKANITYQVTGIHVSERGVFNIDISLRAIGTVAVYYIGAPNVARTVHS